LRQTCFNVKNILTLREIASIFPDRRGFQFHVKVGCCVSGGGGGAFFF
jgi:hypothetical protein